MESNIFICGMQPVGEGSPCYDIFQCHPDLTCSTPIEADFYTCKRHGTLMIANGFTIDLTLCALCVGTSNDAHVGMIDLALKTIFGFVLPICTICKSNGGKIMVRRPLLQ